MNESLNAELKKLDEAILDLTNRLKAKKKARRKLASALEQISLTI